MILRVFCAFLTACVLWGGQTNLVDGRVRLADYGGKHPNDGWDIGAFEYFPGKWIDVPLLFYPDTNIVALPVSLPIPNFVEDQIYRKLLIISNYVSTLPDDPTFSHVRDYITNGFSMKMFFDPRRVMYGFYYNGTYQGTNIHIADYCFLSGIQSNEYVKIIHPRLTLTTNDLVSSYMSSTEMTNLQAMWQDNLMKTVLSSNQHKWVMMEYGTSFYYPAVYGYLKYISTNTYTTNELHQMATDSSNRLSQTQGTDDDVMMVNTVVNYVLHGWVENTNILNNISVHYETQYWTEEYRNEADDLYNRVLMDVVMKLPIQPDRPLAPRSLSFEQL